MKKAQREIEMWGREIDRVMDLFNSRSKWLDCQLCKYDGSLQNNMNNWGRKEVVYDSRLTRVRLPMAMNEHVASYGS